MGSTRRRRAAAVLAALAGAGVVALGVGLWVGPNSSAKTSTSSPAPRASRARPTITAPSPTADARGPTYTTTGNKILADGHPFVPYGITVFGLAYPKWQAHVASDLQQITAIATTWHGNTVRLQVSPDDLFATKGDDAAYVRAIETEVRVAQSERLLVILSAQYERTSTIEMPDAGTVAFWRTVAPVYAHDQGVWFDLFNEPKIGRPTGAAAVAPPSAADWDRWRNGAGEDVGFQTLVDDVRAVAPHNLILAEGLVGAKTLAGLPGHELVGAGLAYAVHPYFAPGFARPAAWNQAWGTLSSSIPIVADEWGERESNRANCQPDAPWLVPRFLTYLQQHGVGLIAWALQSDVLIQGTNLSDPTTFTPGVPFRCGMAVRSSSATGQSTGTQPVQGPGADVLSFFAANSRYPAAAGSVVPSDRDAISAHRFRA